MKKIQNQDSKHSFGGGVSLSKTNIKYIVSLSIVLIGILSLLSGTSYAILKGNTSDTKEQVIKTGKIELTLTESYDNINKKITVMSDEDGLLQEETYDFNIKNTGDAPAKYDLKLINEVPSTYTGKVLDTKYVKIGLEINGTEFGPMSLEKVKNIIDSDIIYKKEMINFKMRIWLDKTKEKDIEKLEDYKAFLKLKIEATQRPESMDSGATKIFNYTGKPEEYTVPRDGYYYIEMAGGAGHAPDSNPNYAGGSKTSGYIKLQAGEKLYFYVGGKAKQQKQEIFNGGGGGGYSNAGYTISSSISGDTGSYGYTGGGATDVRLTSGSWDNTKSLISRIMVAGAGGSASSSAIYNNSGENSESSGLVGNSGGYYSGHGDKSAYGVGAGQTFGGTGGTNLNSYGTNYSGSFGKGGTSNSYSSGVGSSGGGGGYYGGGAGAGTGGGGTGHGAGGGSSYISGLAGVNSVKEMTTITHTNQTLHYSGKYFIGSEVIAGANYDDGYAKITFVDTKPKKRSSKVNNVRYIKNCVNNDSSNSVNNWTEIEAIKDGLNVAKDKSGKIYSSSGSVVESLGTNYAYYYATDGIIDNVEGSIGYTTGTTHTGSQCFIVDLGQTYDLDELAVWHYAKDTRVYFNDYTFVSADNKEWNLVINETKSEDYNGRRYNPYRETYNGYIQDDLRLWYDGYANTGTARANPNYTWKDLSGYNYNGTISSGAWYYKYLALPQETVTSNVALSTMLPAASDRTLSITLKIHEVPYTDTTNGNTGVFLGAAYYNGMGIVWNKAAKETGKIFSTAGFTRTSEITSAGGENLTYPTKILNLTYVNDSSNKKVYYYIDGVKVGEAPSITGSYTYASNMGNVGINKDQKSGGNGLPSKATIDVYSARIYNQALTPEKILHNYHYDKQRFAIKD